MRKTDICGYFVGLTALVGAGVGVILLCSRFEGFRGAYTAPLVLAGVCAVSGTLALALWQQK